MINYESNLAQFIDKKDYASCEQLLEQMSHIYKDFGKFNKKIRQTIIKTCLSNNTLDGMHLTQHPFCHGEQMTDLIETKDFILKLIIGKGQYHLLEDAILSDYTDVKNLTLHLINTKNCDALKNIQNKTKIKLDYVVLLSKYDTIFNDSSDNAFKFLDLLKKNFHSANHIITHSLSQSVMNYNLKGIDYLFLNEADKMSHIMDKWLNYIKDSKKKYVNDEWCFFDATSFNDNKETYFIDVLTKLKKHHPFTIDSSVQKYFIDLFIESKMPIDKLSLKVINFLNATEEIEQTKTPEDVLKYIHSKPIFEQSVFQTYYEKDQLEKLIASHEGVQKKIKI